jgi:ketosteroid isomerase-like protein
MSASNVEVIRRMFDAFNRNEVEPQIEPMSDDYEWRPAFTGGGLVEGNVFRGIEGYRRYLRELEETWSSIELEIDEVRDLGDSVLVLAHIRAIGRASGAEVDQPFGGIWTFADDKLVRGHAYRTRDEALRAAVQRDRES